MATSLYVLHVLKTLKRSNIMPKLIIEKTHNKKQYGKDRYRVVRLIDSHRLSLLETQFDEPSMLRYIQSLPNTYNYEIRNKTGH
jgi:hypothetical protein